VTPRDGTARALTRDPSTCDALADTERCPGCELPACECCHEPGDDEPAEAERDDDDTCPSCCGSGIGRYGDPDTSTCRDCGGSGVARAERDPDYRYDLEREDRYLHEPDSYVPADAGDWGGGVEVWP
jgi:hypothetical protein